MGKNDRRGGGHRAQGASPEPIRGLRQQPSVNTSSAASVPIPANRPTQSPVSVHPALRAADHDRATACIAIRYEKSRPTKKAWAQALAGLPMAIRTQGLVRTFALAKDADEEACLSLLEALRAYHRTKGLAIPGTRIEAVQYFSKQHDIAQLRIIKHEAIELAGWLKALNQVPKDGVSGSESGT